jgi:hypothetical protein
MIDLIMFRASGRSPSDLHDHHAEEFEGGIRTLLEPLYQSLMRSKSASELAAQSSSDRLLSIGQGTEREAVYTFRSLLFHSFVARILR